MSYGKNVRELVNKTNEVRIIDEKMLKTAGKMQF